MRNSEIVYNLLKDNDIFADVYELNDLITVVEINWGDWKHDHLFAENIIMNAFPNSVHRCEITEEDGSDCYSARHLFALIA